MPDASLIVSVGASDADGDALSYSAAAYEIDASAAAAYEIDQAFGLYQWEGNFWTNLRGQGEKYFAGYYEGHNNAYFIMPNGDLYRWGGSIAGSEYVASLGTEYYANPFLLCNAQAPEYAPVAAADVQLSFDGDVLTVTRAADYYGDFVVQVQVSDGVHSASETFAVSVVNAAPELSPIGDQTMAGGSSTLSLTVVAHDADGDSLTYSAQAMWIDPLAERAYELDQTFGLYQWEGSFWTNLRGAGEKYFAGYYAGHRNAYFILPDGDLYRWGGSIATSVYVATLSADYYANPLLLCNAQPPTLASLSSAAIASIWKATC